MGSAIAEFPTPKKIVDTIPVTAIRLAVRMRRQVFINLTRLKYPRYILVVTRLHAWDPSLLQRIACPADVTMKAPSGTTLDVPFGVPNPGLPRRVPTLETLSSERAVLWVLAATMDELFVKLHEDESIWARLSRWVEGFGAGRHARAFDLRPSGGRGLRRGESFEIEWTSIPRGRAKRHNNSGYARGCVV